MTPELTPQDGEAWALVTGAARRIGRSIATALAEDGWNLILHCNRSQDDARDLAADLSRLHGRRMVVAVADLAQSDAADRVFAQCPHFPTLLVNNASVFEEDGLHDFDIAGWDKHMNVNLRAPALLTQAFAGHLAQGASGLIVNLLDAKLSVPNPDFFTYTISKIGFAGLTELTARALAPRVRVNALAPAVTLVSGPQSRTNFEKAHVLNALRRGVDVSHVVAALRYLIATPTVTGETLTLDAGQRFLGLPRDVAYMVED